MGLHPVFKKIVGEGVQYTEGGHVFYPAEYSTPEDPRANCFRLSEGFHNGPECMTCGKVVCEHCQRNFTMELCPFGPFGEKDYTE